MVYYVESHDTGRPALDLLGSASMGDPTGAAVWTGIVTAHAEHACDSLIAVIGMAGRFPGAQDVRAFWKLLVAGREAISNFSEDQVLAAGVPPELVGDARYVRARGMLDDAEWFDNAFFDINPSEALVIDPQHRLFLECAWEALEDAAVVPDRFAGRIGVYAGSNPSDYIQRVRSDAVLYSTFGSFYTCVGNDKDYLTTRLSYKLNLRGPSLCVQTACSTSLVAVHLACQSLLLGECDIALAGGVGVSALEPVGYLYEQGGTNSPDGHCRAFDARAAGGVAGAGLGIVVLSRLADALAAGRPIRAVIRGSAIANDGSQKVSFAAPGVDGQIAAIGDALKIAGVSPATIQYVEAHGSGTALGDSIEVAALTQTYRQVTDRRSFCALGSVKASIGHLNAAAGIASLIKTVLALEHRTIPPSPNFERPNPELALEDSPFFINRAPVEWRTDGGPRRAAVNSLGIGGTNVHVVLEEAPARTASPDSNRDLHIVALSAKTAAALERMTERLATCLRQADVSLADVAYTLHVGRAEHRWRRSAVCRTQSEAIRGLLDSVPSDTAGRAGSSRPIVFMFPGAGSQALSMGLELYSSEPYFRREIDACLDEVQPYVDFSARDVLFASPSDEALERLNRTSVIHPLLFIVEYCLARLWMSVGVQPAAVIGHSVGEYAAAAIAGVFSRERALELVASRGRLIEQAPRGAMLAVALSESDLVPYLRPGVELAAVNDPLACVLAGSHDAIAQFESELQRTGVDSVRIPVSHVSHCSLMDPIIETFRGHVRDATPRPPVLPIASNLSGTWLSDSRAIDANYWAAHLREPVRFADGLSLVLQNPGAILIECGPGYTLSSLARRQCLQATDHLIVSSLSGLEDGLPEDECFARALSQCWAAGVKVDWDAYYADRQARLVSLPSYPFERRRFLLNMARRTDGHAHMSAASIDVIARLTDRELTEHPRPFQASTDEASVVAEQLRVMSKQLDLIESDEELQPSDMSTA